MADKMASKKMMSLEMPDDLREKIRKKAYLEKTSMSETMRRLIAEKLAEEEGE